MAGAAVGGFGDPGPAEQPRGVLRGHPVPAAGRCVPRLGDRVPGTAPTVEVGQLVGVALALLAGLRSDRGHLGVPAGDVPSDRRLLDLVRLGLVLVDVPSHRLGVLASQTPGVDLRQPIAPPAALVELGAPSPIVTVQAEPIPGAVADRQREHERRPAVLVDLVQDRGQLLGAGRSDLRRAHRTGPHAAARNQALEPRGPTVGAAGHHQDCAVLRVPQRAAPAHPSQAGDLLRLRPAAPPGPSCGAGDRLSLATRLRGRTVAAGAWKDCSPVTEGRCGHRAPPAVRAGADAPGVPGPFGPGTLPLLSSTRGAHPASGPGTRAGAAATSTRGSAGSSTGLREPGAPPWTRTPPREQPTGEGTRELRQWW
jgi:hypothetical protein